MGRGDGRRGWSTLAKITMEEEMGGGDRGGNQGGDGRRR